MLSLSILEHTFRPTFVYHSFPMTRGRSLKFSKTGCLSIRYSAVMSFFSGIISVLLSGIFILFDASVNAYQRLGQND